MSHSRYLRTLGLFALMSTLTASAQQVKTVFVIAMENHNWTQPVQIPGKIQQIYQNVNAPFVNSLVNGTAWTMVDGSLVNISSQVAYATAYYNVLANAAGTVSIHPSEPNYIWAEAGTNFGVLNDDNPYADNPPNSQNTPLHLSALLAQAGKTWRSYQEDVDVSSCNVPLPQSQWTVPLISVSGNWGCGAVNAYNGSSQYNYAAKHNPMVFFDDTNGGNNPTVTNPLSTQYAPLQQLPADLANGIVADYNWITPNQYNDMHTALTGGYKGLTGDSANIKQGDDFLSQIVPTIMASNVYKNHGAIILWWDETEADGVPGDIANDFSHTIGEIVISDRAHPNVDGIPYASPVAYTHSSDLRTMQNLFHVGPYIRDAANANDLSDLFKPGVVPKKP